MVLDVELLLSSQTQQPLYVCNDETERRRAWLTRNQVLQALGGARPLSYRRLVLLTDGARINERRHWRTALSARVVVLPVPRDDAERMVMADRHGGKQQRLARISVWWSRYATAYDDHVLDSAAALLPLLTQQR